MKVTQSSLTLCDPMDCSPWNSPGKNTGVGSLPLSRGSYQPRDRTPVSRTVGGFFTSWVTRETLREREYLIPASSSCVSGGREIPIPDPSSPSKLLSRVLEKTLESPLDCKGIKPVNPKGNQPWIFSARTDADVEAPIFWLPDAKSWLTEKDPDAGKD